MTTIKDDLQCSSAERRFEFWLMIVLTLYSLIVEQIKSSCSDRKDVITVGVVV